MPNRIIKESICRSETVDSLSWFEEVLFYRLIVVCDDYGRYDGREKIIKGSCFPLKEITHKDINTALNKLSAAGLVVLYEVDGKPYLQLATWEQHQSVRAKKSKYPTPENNCMQMIADVPVIQSNPNPIRESKTESACESVSMIEDFLSAYPKQGNRHLTGVAYVDILLAGHATEEQLLLSARNYAESCAILEIEKRYIKRPENFLKDIAFHEYLPGIYKKPEKPKKPGNQFNKFEQNNYDFDELEKELISN